MFLTMSYSKMFKVSSFFNFSHTFEMRLFYGLVTNEIYLHYLQIIHYNKELSPEVAFMSNYEIIVNY